MVDWDRLDLLGLPDAALRRRRYDSIAEDLQLLGHKVSGLSLSQVSEASTTAGCLYVLEGSIHGGRFLLNQIEASGLDIPAGATEFLRGFGEDNGRMWNSFVQWLGSLETSPTFINEAEAAAIRSFEGFIHSFEHPQWTR